MLRSPSSVARILTLDEPGHEAFVTRFQQTTGPVIAKGVEDTAFYRYLRLTALNEVGGDPGRFSLPVDEFHRGNIERELRFPLHLLASQTHDTKRSGDVRARIAALTWLRDEWIELVRQLAAARRPQRVVPRLPDDGRRVAARARATRRVPREGAARGEGQHELARAERGARSARACVRRGALRRRAMARGASELRQSVLRRGSDDRPRRDPAQADRSGRARHLPGRRARVALARRPRQPPTRELGHATARRLPRERIRSSS